MLAQASASRSCASWVRGSSPVGCIFVKFFSKFFSPCFRVRARVRVRVRVRFGFGLGVRVGLLLGLVQFPDCRVSSIFKAVPGCRACSHRD